MELFRLLNSILEDWPVYVEQVEQFFEVNEITVWKQLAV